MDIFRVENNVPDVYVKYSRDFQLLSRLKTCLFAASKHDINSIKKITDTQKCRENLLGNLSTKIGFFHNTKINSDALRIILSSFPYLVRSKGTEKAIEETINSYLQASKLYTKCRVNIINKSDFISISKDSDIIKNKKLYYKDNSGNYIPITTTLNMPNEVYYREDIYNIEIGIESNPRDLSIIKEIMRYIKPTGYTVTYVFYNTLPFYQSSIVMGYNETPKIEAGKYIANISRIYPKTEEKEDRDMFEGFVDAALIVSKEDSDKINADGSGKENSTNAESK